MPQETLKSIYSLFTLRAQATQVAILLGLILTGCSDDTAIRKYRVAKSDTQRSSSLPVTANATPVQAAKDQQMLAAIVPNQDTAWFFKLTGDPEVVDKNREQFREIVHSVEFAATGDPSWQLSEGWKQQLLEGITYANLLNSEDGLTATVTRLPFRNDASEESWRQYIVSNINRWRNQLSLEQQSWDAMQGELEEVPELSQGPAKAYFVSLIGKGSGGMAAAPFMSQGGMTPAPSGATNPPVETPAATAPASGNSASPASQSALTYEAPADWQEIAATGMRRAAFTITDDDASAEVTLIPAGGGIQANMGIWLGQVAVESSQENVDETLAAGQSVKVHEVDAKWYSIVGESESILIADIPWRAGESLFVKLKGPSGLVEANREKFVEFLKTIKW